MPRAYIVNEFGTTSLTGLLKARQDLIREYEKNFDSEGFVKDVRKERLAYLKELRLHGEIRTACNKLGIDSKEYVAVEAWLCDRCGKIYTTNPYQCDVCAGRDVYLADYRMRNKKTTKKPSAEGQ